MGWQRFYTRKLAAAYTLPISPASAHLLVWRAGRHIYAAVTGLLLLYYPFGAGVLHLFVPSLLVYLAMHQMQESAATLSWVISFAYLIAWYISLAVAACPLHCMHIRMSTLHTFGACMLRAATSRARAGRNGGKGMWTSQVCALSIQLDPCNQ